MQSIEKGIANLENSSRRLSDAPPVYGEDMGVTRDGGNPQQRRVPKQEIQPSNTLLQLFILQGIIPDPFEPVVKGTRHQVLVMLGHLVPLERGNWGTEGSVQGLYHVEDRDPILRSLGLYSDIPR